MSGAVTFLSIAELWDSVVSAGGNPDGISAGVDFQFQMWLRHHGR